MYTSIRNNVKKEVSEQSRSNHIIHILIKSLVCAFFCFIFYGLQVMYCQTETKISWMEKVQQHLVPFHHHDFVVSFILFCHSGWNFDFLYLKIRCFLKEFLFFFAKQRRIAVIVKNETTLYCNSWFDMYFYIFVLKRIWFWRFDYVYSKVMWLKYFTRIHISRHHWIWRGF